MRTFDLSPLFRSSVGFDRMARMLETVSAEQGQSYPPYNIEKLSDDAYQITMAVAGFSSDDLDVEVQENVLKISGRQQLDTESEAERIYLHRGIATRAFERRFSLAEHIKVEGAKIENGLLHVKLTREVPEEAKPKKIAIESGKSAKSIENKSSK